MSTIVNLGIGFQEPLTCPGIKNLRRVRRAKFALLTPQDQREYPNSSLLESDQKVRKCHALLFSRTCMSRKWM